VVAIGLWDQVPAPCPACVARTKVEFDRDRTFVQAIERLLPPGAAVYQLPYMPFPEGAPLRGLMSYENSRPYLHSSSLKWSFGGMRGRGGDLFFRKLAEQPLAIQVDAARRLGFAGVYLDRRGFEDRGRQAEKELAELVGTTRVAASDDGDRFFYGFASQQPPPEPGLSEQEIIERSGFSAVVGRY